MKRDFAEITKRNPSEARSLIDNAFAHSLLNNHFAKRYNMYRKLYKTIIFAHD